MNSRITTCVLIAICFGVSLFIRVYFPYDSIFTDVGIKFASPDAYYHMRLIDNLAYNFPHVTQFDPYYLYPECTVVGPIIFFDYLMAGVAWVFSLGNPTQHVIDLVGVYLPAILGALVVIPVFFIGRQLFNRWVGIMAATLIAVMPGEFLGRSVLGSTDQHVVEVLFSTTAVLFLILAIQTAIKSSFRRMVFIYSILAGLFLGMYLLTWIGGLFFVLIIAVFFVIQFIVNHLKQKETIYLVVTGSLLFMSTSLVYLPFTQDKVSIIALSIAMVIPVALDSLSHFMAKKQIKLILYPIILITIGLTILFAVYRISPITLRAITEKFIVFYPTTTMLTISETVPLFKYGLVLPWYSFTTGFFFSFIALGLLFYSVIKHESPVKNLLLIWSLVVLIATILQRRFCYYFAVNVSILTAYISWQFIWVSGLKDIVARVKSIKIFSRFTMNHAYTVLAIIFVLIFVYPFNISQSITVAKSTPYTITDDWLVALTWLKDNTPEPLPASNPGAYYDVYEKDYIYPEIAYGIVSWWDYGYWISRIAQRLPITNPAQPPAPIVTVSNLFLSQSEQESIEIMNTLDSPYIIIDKDLTTSKFWAVVTWAGQSTSQYFETYYLEPPLSDKPTWVKFYYPEYYQALVTRLYNFNGMEVKPQRTMVISYEAGDYNKITGSWTFPDYYRASVFIKSQKTDNYRIVGVNPFDSPVPIEALTTYETIYHLETVKIFSYRYGHFISR